MLCEKCQQRPATVHQTICLSDKQVRNDLCEVCAGVKTEEQLECLIQSEQQARQTEVQHISERIQALLFEPRRLVLKHGQLRTHGNATSPDCKLALFAVSSAIGTDPMELLLGSDAERQNHVVRQVEHYEVHITRWDNNPVALLGHLFEPFPDAGARLDTERGFLYVGKEDSLFSNPQKSYAFCNMAAGFFVKRSQQPYATYQFRPRGTDHRL